MHEVIHGQLQVAPAHELELGAPLAWTGLHSLLGCLTPAQLGKAKGRILSCVPVVVWRGNTRFWGFEGASPLNP